MSFGAPTPIFRSFDERKAREFYIDFLGFEVVFEHRFSDAAPLYLGLAMGDCQLHLSEHHGDGCPGASIRIPARNLTAYMQFLRDKKYQNANPGDPVEKPWGSKEITIADPFGNRLTFVETED